MGLGTPDGAVRGWAAGMAAAPVTLSTVHLCHLLLCRHCTCVHFRRALDSQAKWRFHIVITSGCTDQHTAHSTHIGGGAELLLLFF